MTTADPLADRGARLFRFLARAQALSTSSPRTVAAQTKGGAVHWIGEAPEHPAVDLAHSDSEPDDGHLLSIDRVPRVPHPEVPAEITKWVKGDPSKATVPPELLDRIPDGTHWDVSTQAHVERDAELSDHPEVSSAFDAWMRRWRPWAQQEELDAPARGYYADLYSSFVKATSQSEELELVLGVGLLAWKPGESHPEVRRHTYTCQVVAAMDEVTGRLRFDLDETTTGLVSELDMLNPESLKRPSTPREAEAHGEEFEDHPFDREAFRTLGSTLVNSLGAGGEYRDEATLPTPGDEPVLLWSPALLLRPRTNRGIVKIFDEISDRIEHTQRVPEGLRTLVDPDEAPVAQPDPQPGALQIVDGDTFAPLPLNDVQRRIIDRVDSHAQTLVKGPPGTGKTHTAAALLSHLLAQGKRVLVTAHTDRALEEVRSKLPEQIKPLAVSVIGSSRSELTELRTAVEAIARRATDFNPEESRAIIARHLEWITGLGDRRAALSSGLVEAREAEVTERTHATYTGTLAVIARRLAAESERLGWITTLDEELIGPSPIDDVEALAWLALVRDLSLNGDEAESRMTLVDLAQIPSAEALARLVTEQETAQRARSRVTDLLSHDAAAQIGAMPKDERADLQRRMQEVIRHIDSLEQSRSSWVHDALADIRAGATHTWHRRAEAVARLLTQLKAVTDGIPPGAVVSFTGDPGPLIALSEHVRGYLLGGGEIKTNADGSVKIGVFTPGAVKQARTLFESVRINRRPPTTIDSLDVFTAHVRATDLLEQLDRAWPSNVNLPDEDTLGEWTAWHEAEHVQLNRVLKLGVRLLKEEASLAAAGLPRPDWSDLSQVRNYAELVDAAAADEAWRSATQPIETLRELLISATTWHGSAPCVGQLLTAVTEVDYEAYAVARRRLERLHEVSRRLAERSALTDRLRAAIPGLVDAVTASADDPSWDARLSSFAAAWDWATTRHWIIGQSSGDANDIQGQVALVETQIRESVEVIAAERAWGHAVSADRLSQAARADLVHYSQLVQKRGKGTGKHAARQLAGIRAAMTRCRPSVPVWIMPIYQIAQQLEVEEHMFDVVLVDEASQAGLEASFLQYLAKQIVVIGDDKQVSPTAVGENTDQWVGLMKQYIDDDPYKDAWSEPKQSFFDEAVKRYGGQLTLVEHRRCVPEIIGFSNRIAYEPSGVPLVPVRQFGADRLDPIRLVHLPSAAEEGRSGNKANPGEARAIVEQIKTLIDDPRYDGLTFGVISLVGAKQAQLIGGIIDTEIEPDEAIRRQLRVGDAADFQGSERDVIFLSMVSSRNEGARIASLVTERYLQRFNVAVSRAKDQLWLFHSITREELKNKEDMRFQLLDYCHEVTSRRRDLAPATPEPAPDDLLITPFRSLFQQHVYNRIVAAGFAVVPEFDANGYAIDLVVVGSATRLAVLCEGDTWPGREAYALDLTRQRDLERCGWHFFRVRESAFCLDADNALEGLWQLLDELGIDTLDSLLAEVVGDEADSSAVVLGDDGQLGVEHLDSSPSEVTGLDDDVIAARVVEPAPAVVTAGLASWSLEEGRLAEDLENEDPFEDHRKVLPYTAFGGRVPALSSPASEVIDGIVDIVRVEGPMTGDRLRSVYVGQRRISKQSAAILNPLITRAVKTGELVEDNPLKQAGIGPKTYRLPHQPLARVRDLGERKLDQVPPSERAELIRLANAGLDWTSMSELFAHALALAGGPSLGADEREALEVVMPLAFRQVGADEPHEADEVDAADESTSAESDHFEVPDRGRHAVDVTADTPVAVSTSPESPVLLNDRPETWRRYGRDREEWASLVDAATSLLRTVAGQRGSLTYSDLNNALTEEAGVRSFDLRSDVGRRALGDLLGDVTTIDFPSSGLMLSAIVTLKGQADVGQGFFASAQRLALLPKGASALDKEAFWISQVAQVHDRFASRTS